MKRRLLNRFDTLSSGYFSVGIALLNLVILGCLAVAPNPWICISMAGLAMLGITEIVKADNPQFPQRHPWLMRLIYCTMTMPAFVILCEAYYANELEFSHIAVGAIPAIIAVAALCWYLRRHGVDAENYLTSDDTPNRTASNNKGES